MQKKLANRLEELLKECPEQWDIEKEPHSYNDGTTHFNHVGFDIDDRAHRCMIGQYLTPEAAELLVLLKNNLPTIIEALKK